MTDIKQVLPGDVFCTANPWIVGRMINAAEKVWSKDNRAEYGHAGIIIDTAGTTLEALVTVRHGALSDYKDKPIMIARPTTQMDGPSINNIPLAISRVEGNHLGQWYPAWRLILHLFPPLAKYVASKKFLVCSELVAKYLFYLGARHSQYMGTNPDTLADEWKRWRNFEIIFEGVWE